MEQFGDLLIEQIPRLRRYARALTRDSGTADDLVQDCLGRAWSRQRRWQADSNLRAWLFTIMHNLYVNKIRKLKRQSGSEPLDVREHRDPVRSGQDRAMDLRDLESGLSTLPDDQREVLVMVCLEEMSYRQVADTLAVPIGTVMSRLHRGRERLRRWMNGEHPARLRQIK